MSSFNKHNASSSNWSASSSSPSKGSWRESESNNWGSYSTGASQWGGKSSYNSSSNWWGYSAKGYGKGKGSGKGGKSPKTITQRSGVVALAANKDASSKSGVPVTEKPNAGLKVMDKPPTSNEVAAHLIQKQMLLQQQKNALAVNALLKARQAAAVQQAVAAAAASAAASPVSSPAPGLSLGNEEAVSEEEEPEWWMPTELPPKGC